MPIVKICSNQPSLAVKLNAAGCMGGQITSDQIRLEIRAPQHGCVINSHLIFNGFWPSRETPWTDRPAPHEFPGILYPAFAIDDDGQAVFRFDNKLWSLPPGRYIAILEWMDGTIIDKFDLDICATPYTLAGISLTQKSSCPDGGGC